jgi:alcohol dehydrogenase
MMLRAKVPLAAHPTNTMLDSGRQRLCLRWWRTRPPGLAPQFGATHTINSADGRAADTVKAQTGGRGLDTAIEAVGVPATFELCQNLVAPGGVIIGVHGAKVDLHLERLWSQNISITTRLVDTVTTPMVLKTVQAKKSIRPG